MNNENNEIKNIDIKNNEINLLVSEIDALKRALHREKSIRKEAELIIENKSRELYDTNEKLKNINVNLEKIVNDRTEELSRKNQEIIHTNQKLEIALDIRHKILSGLGHELLTPIHIIVGNIELLNIDKKDNSEEFKNIQENLYSLLKIVKNLTYFSDLEIGKIKPNFTYFSINKLLDNLSSAFNYLRNNKNITLLINNPIDLRIKSDIEILFYIFINLIDNSVKHSNAKNVNINVNFELVNRNENSDSNSVLTVNNILNTTSLINNNINLDEINSKNYKLILNFEIFDDGIGIKESILENIFVPFSKYDGTNYYDNRGSGLGLPIIKILVELLFGSVKVESNTNSGTKFNLVFEDFDYKLKLINQGNKSQKLVLPPHLKVEFDQIKNSMIIDNYEEFSKSLINHVTSLDVTNLNQIIEDELNSNTNSNTNELRKLGIKLLEACENMDILTIKNLIEEIE